MYFENIPVYCSYHGPLSPPVSVITAPGEYSVGTDKEPHVNIGKSKDNEPIYIFTRQDT